MKKFIDNITSYFFYLTRDNWGASWHVIIAMVLSKLIVFGFSFVVIHLENPQLWISLMSIMIVNLIGYPYEVYQRKEFIIRNYKSSNYEYLMKKFNKGTKQDLLANLIGSILGAL